MLARSHGLRLDHNQENPATSSRHHDLLPTKTPARAGKSAAPQTGGKGLLTTAKTGRVLGAKDRNQGKRDGNEPTGLLFPGKPSTSQAGPSQPFKTPAPRKTLRPLQDMVTPATGVRPKHAPPLMLASPSPDVSMEVDEQGPQEDEESDREVEYAGASARDYDEPFIPDHPEPDYKTAGFGAALRSMSFGGMESYSEWAERDAAERAAIRIELDAESEKPSCLARSPSDQPLFPVPSTRRAPLSAKPTNASSSTPRTLSSSQNRTPSTQTASSRKPLASSTSTASARRPLSSAIANAKSSSENTLRRPLAPSNATSGLRSTPSSRLAPTLSSSKPSLSSSSSAGASSTVTKPTFAPRSTSSTSATALIRPTRPTGLALSRPSSSASFQSAATTGLRSKLALSPSIPSPAVDVEKAKRKEEERELGIFGIVDEGVEDELLDFGDEAMEEAFKFDLEL
ncbi:hypothetical protein JCM11251_005836 [Rhodosporidiobolus azoricus]